MSLVDRSLEAVITGCRSPLVSWFSEKVCLNKTRIDRQRMKKSVVESVVERSCQGKISRYRVAKQAKELQMLYNSSKINRLERKLASATSREMGKVRHLNSEIRDAESWNNSLDERSILKEPETVIKDLAEYYIGDMAADFNPLFFVLFRSLARRSFPNFINSIHVKSENDSTVSKILELQGKEPVIYLPNHVSNADHIPLCFALNSMGAYHPLIAAGANLFRGISKEMLYYLNAYKIRREALGEGFGPLSRLKWFSNPVYAMTHNEYLKYVWNENEPMLFYIEGTRSRDGQLGTPKAGIMKNLVDYIEDTHRSVSLVPVSLSYNIVPEDVEIEAARAGANISEKDLFKQLMELNNEYGGLADPSIYVNLSDPIRIGPKDPKSVKDIIRKVMARIGDGVVNTPTYMLASGIIESAHSHAGNLMFTEDCIDEFFGMNRHEYPHTQDLEEGIASSLHDFEMKGFIEPVVGLGDGRPKHWRITNLPLVEQYNNRTAHKY